jgi:hypothetical protein
MDRFLVKDKVTGELWHVVECIGGTDVYYIMAKGKNDMSVRSYDRFWESFERAE